MEQKLALSSSPTDLERPDLYINRELSWIEFNRRVFGEAKSPRHPLLERVKFISIFETNLDEFVMIRLAGLKDQAASHLGVRSPDGRTAEQQLTAVRRQVSSLLEEVRQYWRDELLPLLADQGIYILDYNQLDEQQQAMMGEYFEQEVFPVLTPLAVDYKVHPFPHISSLSLNLAVVLKDKDPLQGELFARIKVPPSLPRLVPVPLVCPKEESQAVVFVWLEQLIAANLHLLFPGFEAWESYPFRVIRDADIEIQEDDAGDLLQYIAQEVRERRFGSVVDLAVNPSMPKSVRRRLLDGLRISSRHLTVIDGPLGMGDVMALRDLERPELKDTPFTPRDPAFLRQETDIFAAMRKQDVMLHHPYDSFNSVVDFIRAAADDPQVLAIKQTLYRVGSRQDIVLALQRAVEKGKQVAVVVELKARFDEENNIVWARALEDKGVHVVYGQIGLKTHAKVALVVRKEENVLRRYVHLGTGNYNATTAKIYEDLCLLTCQDEICADATALFNSLTGYSRKHNYLRLLVAPVSLRRTIIERIEREIRWHEQFGNGRIIMKMNALTDLPIIKWLYQASRAGVDIDLIVRGICCLRPGLRGFSETIRVRSIVGRFLEHSRIYCFGNNGQEEFFMGSADMMQRNLSNRVETLVPVEDARLCEAIGERILKPLLADTVNAHALQPDGSYTRILPHDDMQPFDCQAWFITHPLFDEEDDDV